VGEDEAEEARLEDRDVDRQFMLPVPAENPVDVGRRIAERFRPRQEAVRAGSRQRQHAGVAGPHRRQARLVQLGDVGVALLDGGIGGGAV